MDKFSIDHLNRRIKVEDSAIIEYILENFDPADVFAKEQLRQWAESNGYAKGNK